MAGEPQISTSILIQDRFSNVVDSYIKRIGAAGNMTVEKLNKMMVL